MSAVKILFVDDEANVLTALARTFRGEGYEVQLASSGAEALEIVQSDPPDMVVSDHRMPVMTGVELLTQVREAAPGTIRILLTGYADIQAATDAINLGGVYRFLTKPWNSDDLKITVRQALHQRELEQQNSLLSTTVNEQNEKLRELNAGLEQKVEERTTEVKRLYSELQDHFVHSVKVFIELVSLRNPNLTNHCKRVAAYCKAVARRLDLDPQRVFDIELAAVLHDIGKIGMSDVLIDYSARTLSAGEQTQLEMHPLLGEKVITPIPELAAAARLIRSHHEQYDGKGYPDHRRRDDIPLGARLIAIADAFDHAVFGHKFGEPMPKQLAFDMLSRRSGYDFDPELVGLFAQELSRGRSEADSHTELKVSLGDLCPGMLTARDIRTRSGILRVPKGQQLLEDDIRRLISHDKVDTIVSGVFVNPAAASV